MFLAIECLAAAQFPKFSFGSVISTLWGHVLPVPILDPPLLSHGCNICTNSVHTEAVAAEQKCWPVWPKSHVRGAAV